MVFYGLRDILSKRLEDSVDAHTLGNEDNGPGEFLGKGTRRFRDLVALGLDSFVVTFRKET
jgi:hypothetical protein